MDAVVIFVDIPPQLWEPVDRVLRQLSPEHVMLRQDIPSQELLATEMRLSREYQEHGQFSSEFAALWSYFFKSLTERDDQRVAAIVFGIPVWRIICRRHRFLLEALKLRNAAENEVDEIAIFVVGPDGTPERLVSEN